MEPSPDLGPGAAGILRPSPPIPTASTTTPFDNDLIFNMIMKYVATDRESLKASRLISHLWNGKAMEVFRQENSSILSIRSDREAYWKERNPESRAPSASLEHLLSCGEVDTNPNLEKAVDQIGLKFCTRDLQIDSESTTQLLQVLPANPQMKITAIEFDGCRYPAVNASFWRLVEECAPSLKTLKFTVKLELESEDSLPSLTPYLTTTLPNLTSIWVTYPSGEFHPRFYQLPLEIAGQAPNVATLRVHGGIQDSLVDRKSVTSLMTSRLLSTTSTLFHELAVPLPVIFQLGQHELPNGYREIIQRFNKHQVLNLMLDVRPVNFLRQHFDEYVTNLLEPSRVVSLELNWTFRGEYFLQPEPNQVVVGHLPRLIGIPSLPNLTHLGMSSVCSSTTSRTDPCQYWYTCDFLRTAASHWTGIKSFSISQCLLIKLASGNYLRFMREHRPDLGLWYLQFNFPSVATLVLTHPTQCGAMDVVSDQLPIIITSVFPNLQEIVIDLRDCDEAAWKILETRILPKILKVRGIRRLDFENYYINALGNFKVGIQDSPLSESLVHLELKLGKNDHWGYADFLLPTDLAAILRPLSNLKVLRVDPRLMASSSGGGDFSKIIEEVRPIREQFPSVDIKLM